MTADPETISRTKHVWLARLEFEHDETVLAPRPWTVTQAVWAAELSYRAPHGPILELCAGVGHIGIIAALESRRRLVQVDHSPMACHFARKNASRAGLGDSVEVRCAELTDSVGDGERFPLVIADPPYIPTAGVGRFPEDPIDAIDGGADGLDLARLCLTVMADVLMPGGAGLLQVAGREQVEQLRRELPSRLHEHESRLYGPDRAVMLLTFASPTRAER